MTATNTPSFIDAGELSLLKGRHVSLDFLTEEHRDMLRPLARDERVWEFTRTLLIDDTYDRQFDNYFNEALATAGAGGQAFAIVSGGDGGGRSGEGAGHGSDHQGGGRIIGMTRAYDIDRKVKKATIGHTWYLPEVWGKVYNKECKLLLLKYIFETLGLARVDFKVAGQNLRSQKAVARIGGVKEGVLRNYALRNDGTLTDTVYFSILGDEWPEKKERLLQLVAEARD